MKIDEDFSLEPARLIGHRQASPFFSLGSSSRFEDRFEDLGKFDDQTTIAEQPDHSKLEQHEYDQKYLDKKTGKTTKQHVTTKDVKSEDGSVIMHSEIRTFGGDENDATVTTGSSSSSSKTIQYDDNVEGFINFNKLLGNLFEVNDVQDATGGLEDAEAEYDADANSDEDAQQHVLDQAVSTSGTAEKILTKKSQLQAKLDKLRAEEKLISKMMNEIVDDEGEDEEYGAANTLQASELDKESHLKFTPELK